MERFLGRESFPRRNEKGQLRIMHLKKVAALGKKIKNLKKKNIWKIV